MSQEIKILSVIGGLTLVLVVGGAFFLGGNSSNQTTVADPKILVRSDSEKISTPSAKVTIVEFGDYQCPACGAAFPIAKRIINDYKGKINFVFRHFAFIGPESTWAAEAAECAGEQGKFWDYHDYLYEHQSGENQGAFSKDNLKSFAKILSLDTPKFNSCLDSDKYSGKVSSDTNDGKTLGVNSTPTFFINGEKEIGVLNYNAFKSKIDSLLSK